MNLHHTASRNKLLVATVSNLMMISINGLPLQLCNVKKYVISWIKKGRHGALDKAAGPPKQTVVLKHSAKLFS